MRVIILGKGGYTANGLETFQFLIRRLIPMVFALGGDIMRRVLEKPWADGIIGITALPVEINISRMQARQPMRCARLDVTHDIALRPVHGPISQYVDVVLYAANHHGFHAELPSDAANVPMHAQHVIGVYLRASGAKYYMPEIAMAGMAHDYTPCYHETRTCQYANYPPILYFARLAHQI